MASVELFLFVCLVPGLLGQSAVHPLEPLSAAEIRATATLINARQPTNTGWIFNWITLLEPPKATLLPVIGGGDWSRIPRLAFAVLIERRTGRVFELIVNLGLGRIDKVEALPPGTQPTVTPEDLTAAEVLFKADPGVRERCSRLGYNDMDNVYADAWAIGYIGDRPEWKNRRVLQIFPYGVNFRDDNQFTHPLDFTAVVDIIEERLLAIEDLPVHHQFSPRNGNRGVTVPRAMAQYDQRLRTANGSTTATTTNGQRRGPSVQPSRPIPVQQARPVQPTRPVPVQPSRPVQPQPQQGRGPTQNRPTYPNNPPPNPWRRFRRQSQQSRTTGLRVSGNLIQWDNFRIRIGFNGREGLVLHDVKYQDGPVTRPLLYRASLVEMFVPYADPRPPYHRKAVYDMGEYGLGFWANALAPTADCGQGAAFFSGNVNNHRGEPVGRPNAICAFEEDTGVLWKHTNARNRRVSHARARRLVLATIATVGNYDYAFYWYFGLDASIQFTVKATGILDTELLAAGEDTFGYGIQIFPQVNTQFHQHMFAVRLDTMFDGPGNSVAVVDVEPEAAPTGSPQNPYGQAFSIKTTPLRTAREACTRINPLKGRTWEISSPGRLHPFVKESSGWRLIPANSPPVLMRRDSPLFFKAGFSAYDVWVTPFKDREIYPGGFYLNNGGLPTIVNADPGASLENKDIVIWHVFGLTHIPRAEDFPIMPVEETGFTLRPHNFFLQNPSLRHGLTVSLPPDPQAQAG